MWMKSRFFSWTLRACIFLLLTPRAHGEVTDADFDVAPGRIDAAVDRLAAKDFADLARPAATLLARRKPAFMPAGRDPRLTDAEHEARHRQLEPPAYTVARLVWARRAADPDAEPVARLLGEIAADRRGTEADIRKIAIQTLAAGGKGRRAMSDVRHTALYRLANEDQDDAALRLLAAEALMRDPPAGPGQQGEYDDLLRNLPAIVRAQPTLAARHAAFNDLTNIGRRLHGLPVDRFAELLRLGFGLIEETPRDVSAGAYGTAHRLGYMLRRADEFMPPKKEHGDGTGNLAPSFFLQTAENARQWWVESGKRALESIAPAND